MLWNIQHSAEQLNSSKDYVATSRILPNFWNFHGMFFLHLWKLKVWKWYFSFWQIVKKKKNKQTKKKKQKKHGNSRILDFCAWCTALLSYQNYKLAKTYACPLSTYALPIFAKCQHCQSVSSGIVAMRKPSLVQFGLFPCTNSGSDLNLLIFSVHVLCTRHVLCSLNVIFSVYLITGIQQFKTHQTQVGEIDDRKYKSEAKACWVLIVCFCTESLHSTSKHRGCCH